MIPQFVIIFLLFMNATVNFNYKTNLIAVKIGYEPVDDLLTPEVKPFDLVLPNHIPESFFSQSHSLPELFGKFELFVAYFLTFY